MGWSRSVVTWWYLYNEERELDALILEINNSYWEKRNILLRIKPTSDKLNPCQSLDSAEYLDRRQLVRSLPTATKAKFYGGDWRKYIFASPFEKVDGLVSQRMMDPLKPHSWASGSTLSNMTTLEETGEVRMATRLTCDGYPIDPTRMSYIDVIKVIIYWTLPVIMTTPEIFFKAIKIRLSGMMKMNSKPPVRSGSVGRHIKRLELNLEAYFRAYLARCVDNYPEPVELKYLPCRSFTNDTVYMRSPSFYEKGPTIVRYLTVEPADPSFYTRIINYMDVKTALDQEAQQTGHIADPTAQRLIVSDTSLLKSILEYSSFSFHEEEAVTFSRWKLRQMLLLTRPKSTLTFMDIFILSSLEPRSCMTYMSSRLRLSAAHTLAADSQRLLSIYLFVASCLIRWSVLELFSRARVCIFSSTGLHYPHWVTLASAVLEYCLMLKGLAVMQRWLM
ncbi:conserved hypothetical protein [Talaromyces stipitatus ATCC 10500]|uniref:Uncharacterized protein n=1 Tax=Talaromyces stipitatus (strain ATCC 10500 / CBS 375.48 / QM 6759 / NRRL 1006) TaxID=441959 RepID=B8MQW3_TALSN|nr:uncharacterized protein TSTA_053160 [Talaromyces stipitatus ATCC 10500]EED12798.1 conserved hypothetical protein [Talaromyces stipitatus ATCC 10500]